MKIDLPEFSMAYSESGQGQPVLFIHGYPLNRQMWQPQLVGLAGEVRVLAVDLRGHGESGGPPGSYSMDLFAEDCRHFLDALGVTQPVVVCGLSMGGYVAFAFYRKYAARLAGLILTATRAKDDSPEARANRDKSIALVQEQGILPVVESMLPRLLSPKSLAGRPELVAQVQAILSSTPPQTAVSDLAALRDRPDASPMLPEIHVPVLVIHGADDPIVPLAEAQAMHAAIPGAKLHVLPGAAHLPNMEQAERFNDAVKEFCC